MRCGPLVLSLVGMSCTSAGRGPGAWLAARRTRTAGPPALVSRAPLGATQVSKWRLGNGLEVVLAPDPGATSVSYTTWFRVGSRHEDALAGETGLAHLFEHLMFTQTRGAKEAGAFDRQMEEVGGNANAMTYYDFTAYVDNVPPDALRLAIQLEADRMVNLALRDEQVATEREVVVEERLSTVEDSVEGVLDEKMYAQAFQRHPYRFPVIGLMKDIRAVTPAKAVRFYRRFYAPNNAVIVAAGRLDEADTLAAIAEHYGAIAPSQELTRDGAPAEQAPRATVRAELERPVPADRFVIGFRAPALADPDRAAYEVVAELLAGGPSSRLHRRLVVNGELASSVAIDVPETRDAALCALWVQMTRGHVAAEAEAIVDEELTALATRPVAPPELDKAKTQLEAQFWRALGSSQGRAERLGQFEVSAGDHRKLLGRARDYAAVTPGDLSRIVSAYLTPARSVVVARPKPE